MTEKPTGTDQRTPWVEGTEPMGPAYWMSPEEARASFEEEDRRWAARDQLVDWLFLLGMIVLYAVWTLSAYFLEPGLR